MGIAPQVYLLFSGAIARGIFATLGLACMVLNILATISFTVAWIRVAVLGPGSVSRRKVFCFGRPERNILIFIVLAMLGSLPFAAVPILILVLTRSVAATVLVGLILIAALLFCFLRLAFLYPQISLARYEGLRAGWNLTKGYAVQLLLLYLLLAFPIGVIAAIPQMLGSMSRQSTPVVHSASWMLVAAIGAILSLYVAAVSTGGIALAYKYAEERRRLRQAAA